MKKLFALCIGIGIGLPAVAAAEVMDLGRPVPQRRHTQAQGPAPAKTIIFGDEDPVVGALPNGDGTEIYVRPGGRFPGLIKLRSSFVAEMLKSAENC